MNPAAAKDRAVVVGAGVVGVNVALALLTRGFDVTIVDPLAPGTATSAGNAGCFATADITPISMPGLIWSVPRMLADPLGPLSVRWRNLPTLAPWLWRFWRSAGRTQVERATAALGSLVGRLWEDWTPVIETAGLGDMVRRAGGLFVYETTRGFMAAQPEWALRRRYGVKVEHVRAPVIRDLEPDLAPIFGDGYFVSGWGHVTDPALLVARLGEHFCARGGAIVAQRAEQVRFHDGRATALQLGDGRELPFERLVVAAGPWSGALARTLGHKVPLDTERGYNTTLPDPGVTLTRPVCCAERSFVMTPMALGLRIGGAVELASLQAPPNFARSRALLQLGREALPRLNTANGREWMGCRPSMPDSLPVIARSPRDANLLFAFGHGHLGLTEAATTGRLIGELARDEPTVVDVTPFRIDRFS